MFKPLVKILTSLLLFLGILNFSLISFGNPVIDKAQTWLALDNPTSTSIISLIRQDQKIVDRALGRDPASPDPDPDPPDPPDPKG